MATKRRPAVPVGRYEATLVDLCCARSSGGLTATIELTRLRGAGEECCVGRRVVVGLGVETDDAKDGPVERQRLERWASCVKNALWLVAKA